MASSEEAEMLETSEILRKTALEEAEVYFN